MKLTISFGGKDDLFVRQNGRQHIGFFLQSTHYRTVTCLGTHMTVTWSAKTQNAVKLLLKVSDHLCVWHCSLERKQVNKSERYNPSDQLQRISALIK